MARDLAARYRVRRTLRTRATGTPFRVQWDANGLAVTPMSGFPRTVSMTEIHTVWPLIARGATLSALKAQSNNSSYLQAIYDDVTNAELELIDRPETSATQALANSSLDESKRERDSATSLAAARVELESLQSRLDRETADSADLKRNIAALESQVTHQSNLDERLTEAQRANDAAATSLADAQAELRDAHHRLQRETRNEADLKVTVASLQTEVKELQAKMKSVATIVPDVVVQFDGQELRVSDALRPELKEGLRHALETAIKHPTASVAESRLILESAIKLLFREAKGEDPPSDSVSVLLDALYGDPHLPLGDWHLAKNLYHRASAIIHGAGRSRPDLALWMYFGTAQFCELVPNDPA